MGYSPYLSPENAPSLGAALVGNASSEILFDDADIGSSSANARSPGITIVRITPPEAALDARSSDEISLVLLMRLRRRAGWFYSRAACRMRTKPQSLISHRVASR